MLMFVLGMICGAVASIAIEHKVLPKIKEKLKKLLVD